MPACDRIKPGVASRVLQVALQQKGLITPEDRTLHFCDVGFLRRRIREVKDAFPSDTLHAAAVKAHPLSDTLAIVRDQGLGFEVASQGEMLLALRAGVEADRIIYDAPGKPTEDIRRVLEAGIYINADSLGELKRIDEILGGHAPKGKIGIRINPQNRDVAGNIESTTTGGYYSKFGVPLLERRQALLAAFQQYPWLTGVHVHVGSQTRGLDYLIEGAASVLGFAEEVNRLTEGQIRTFDIGGGLPVAYDDRSVSTMTEYAAALRMGCPGLFSGQYRLMTEFGRHLFGNMGWTVSRIADVKEEYASHVIAVMDIGADQLVRECYRRHDWPHEYVLLDKNGRLRESDESTGHLPLVIAGPLCFSDDMPINFAQAIPVPRPSEGDLVYIGDTGSYTFAMGSCYNSRPMSKVVGYELVEGGLLFFVLKERETPEQVVGRWAGPTEKREWLAPLST